MSNNTDLESEILAMRCGECHEGHFHRGTADVGFHRTYSGVEIALRITGVPAFICDACPYKLILPTVERRLWEQVQTIEQSKEFLQFIESRKRLIEHHRSIHRATQSIDIQYAA